MTQVVHSFSVVGLGTSRDECITILDDTSNAILDHLGGAPWKMTDDDIKRVQAGQVSPPLADSDGFCYIGTRTLVYSGPVVRQTNMIEHDGFRVQAKVAQDDD